MTIEEGLKSDDIEIIQLAVNILVNQENYTVIDIKEKLNFTIFEIDYEKSDYVINQIILRINWKKYMRKHMILEQELYFKQIIKMKL
jgi:hypothetical protein